MLDVHKTDIVQMSLIRNLNKELRLVSICSKGVVAEWDPLT